MFSTERWELAFGLWLCQSGRSRLPLVGWASRPHKVPCGDAAISKMQIAHFLDFISVDLDMGGERQTAYTI